MAYSLELIDVSKSAGSSRTLHEVNFAAVAGEVTAICGGRGAGKTALVRLVAGLERPEEGAVLVRGRDVANATGRALQRIQRGLAVMLQGDASGSCGLFDSATVRENVAFPVRQAGHVSARRTDRLVDSYLERAGLAHLADERPAALDLPTRKRVALVRALAMRAPLVVLDDPDGRVGPHDLRLMHDLLTAERDERSRTFVLATTSSALAAAVADRVITLDDGRVVEDAAARGELQAVGPGVT
jgi:D-methionine transport system ATP-binding protein